MDNPNDEELTGVKKLTPAEEAWHKEQFRRSQDLIRVYNPTGKDYKVDYDGFIYIVPAHQEKTLVRYIASKYCRGMKDLIINQRNDTELAKQLADRETKGMMPLTPYEKQTLINKLPKTNDEELVKEIYNIIWLGTEEEFGLDATNIQSEEQLATVPIEEKVLSMMERKYVAKDEPAGQEDVLQGQAVPKTKKKIASEVSE